MNKYNKIGFVNGSAPALNADNLNHMDEGIELATDGVIAVEEDIKTATADLTAVKSEVETARGEYDNLGQRLDGIDTTVGNKADKSTVSQLSARMQSAEIAIAGKANATDVTNALKAKANTADVDTAVENINTTIANNQKAVNTSLDTISTALNNKVDTDVVEEVKKSVESNTTAIEGKENTLLKVSNSVDVKDATKNYPSIEYINNYCVGSTYASRTFEKTSNRKSNISESIAAKNIAYPSIKYLEDYIKDYATNYYKQSEIDTLLLAKYDAANIESGTSALTPYSTVTDKIKSASCTYKTIGDVVLVDVDIVMNAVTMGANSSYPLIDLPYKNVSANAKYFVGISSGNKLLKGSVPKNNTWLQFSAQDKTAYTFADGEQINFSLLYKIK